MNEKLVSNRALSLASYTGNLQKFLEYGNAFVVINNFASPKSGGNKAEIRNSLDWTRPTASASVILKSV